MQHHPHAQLMSMFNCSTVDGQWSTWGEWGRCRSHDCANEPSSQLRSRLCNNPAPLHEGKQCLGWSVAKRECLHSEECTANPGTSLQRFPVLISFNDACDSKSLWITHLTTKLLRYYVLTHPCLSPIATLNNVR